MPRSRIVTGEKVTRIFSILVTTSEKLDSMTRNSGHRYGGEVLDILIANATDADAIPNKLREALLAGDQQQEVSAGDETERPGESADGEPVEAVETAN